MAFQKKQLKKTKRVCLRLKEARKAAGFTLADLSEKTKISKKHLQALEECRYGDIPYAQVYQKNFVRRYAEAINVPVEPLLRQFLIEEAKADTQHKLAQTRIRKHRFQNLPGILKGLALATVVLGLVGYLGWQVRAIVTPPSLVVYGPRDGYVTEQPGVLVHGEAGQEARVYINGQEISTDGQGHFEQELDLSPGINPLVISAKKRHGKKTELTRHVIVKEVVEFSLGNRLTP